jgi:hypothetical protein
MRWYLIRTSVELTGIPMPELAFAPGVTMSEIPELNALLNTLTGPVPNGWGVVNPGAYVFHQSGPNRLETGCVPTTFRSLMFGEFTIGIKIWVGLQLHTGHVVTPDEAQGHAARAANLAATAVAKMLDWGNQQSQAQRAFKDYTEQILQHEHPTYGYRVQDCTGHL